MQNFSRALQSGIAYALYSVPWAIARSYVLSRNALRFAWAAIRLGWKEGMTDGPA